MIDTYLPELKAAVTGGSTTPLAFICNFEAETLWSTGHVGLPAAMLGGASRMVARMEELGVLLAGPGDVLILGQDLDPGYQEYLHGRGLDTAATLVPAPAADGPTSAASTSERLRGDAGGLARLAGFAAAGGQLMPMATTRVEDDICASAGIPLAVPDSATFERVNGKIFGRRLTESCGLRMVPGTNCEDVATLDAALDRARRAGDTVVVKDSFGVSGKGLLVCDSDRRFDQLRRMVHRRAERTGDDRIEVVVERWLPKRFDLNYQATITRSGEVSLTFVKQAVTERGVHQGHRMPVELSPAHRAELLDAAVAIGAGLHAEGYWGVAGIDAVLGADGALYPVLEINARLNMSSYQGRVVDRFDRPGGVGLARYHRLRLAEPCSFGRIHDALGELLDVRRQEFAVIAGFGTVNANHDATGRPFEGRLYVVEFAADPRALDGLDARLGERLRAVGVSDEDVAA